MFSTYCIAFILHQAMVGYDETKLQGDTRATGQASGCQEDAIKLVQPLFHRPGHKC